MDGLQIDEILEIMSNQHRRTILRLLTEREYYAFELTKELEISQRAVKKHLDYLQELGLIKSEKRKSTKGPKREYFSLDKAVIFSLTIAPNLFQAAIRPLSEPSFGTPITPSLQLNAPSSDIESPVIGALKEGIALLPQIRQGLDMLQVEQSKLLRGYQGIQSHITDNLAQNGYTSKEIRLILHLMEKEGTLLQSDITFTYGDYSSIHETVMSLRDKNILSIELDPDNSNSLSIHLIEEI